MECSYNKYKSVILLIQGIFIYSWLVNLQGTDSYYSVYILVAVASFFAMHRNFVISDGIKDKHCISVSVFAAVFSAAVLVANYSLFVPWTSLLNLFNALCTFIGGWVVFGHFLAFLLHALPVKTDYSRRNHGASVFGISFLIISAVYLSYLFFHSYPGLLSTDSFTTIRQITSGRFDNTMPFYHTVLVGLFFKPAYAVFGNVNDAIAAYHVVQILFSAACFAYTVMTLYQIGVPSWIVATVFGGYAILPYHIVYSVTLWKDIPFGAAAVLTVTALYRVIKKIGKAVWNEIVFTVGSVGLCLLRTNGWYAFAATTIVMLILLYRKHRRLLRIMICILVVCWLLINPLLSVLQVSDTDFVEALAVPFQQVARVVATGCPLAADEEVLLSELFDLELVKEKYNPNTVDPIKFETFRYRNKEYLKENALQYMGLWLKLGVKYPGVYLQAWVEETKGYWNGGYPYYIYIHHMGENEMGFIQTGGQNMIGKMFDALFRYIERPVVLQPLYSIGLCIWLIMISVFLCIRQRREQYVIAIPILVLIAGLWIGTPVYAEFRYAYPAFTSVPMIVCAAVFEGNKTEN